MIFEIIVMLAEDATLQIDELAYELLYFVLVVSGSVISLAEKELCWILQRLHGVIAGAVYKF